MTLGSSFSEVEYDHGGFLCFGYLECDEDDDDNESGVGVNGGCEEEESDESSTVVPTVVVLPTRSVNVVVVGNEFTRW